MAEAARITAADAAVGQRFGRLLVTAVVKQGRGARVLARCSCGSTPKDYRLDGLKAGKVLSCGCLKKETDRQAKTKLQGSFADVLHKRFGRLLATGLHRETGRPTRIVCRCDCGAQALVIPAKLRSGETTSCGCFHQERLVELGAATVDHGQASHGPLASGQTSTYRAWQKIRALCRAAEKRPGSTVSAEYDPAWESFDGFFRDWGEIGIDETVIRRDRSRAWEKSNCFVGLGPKDGRRKSADEHRRAALLKKMPESVRAAVDSTNPTTDH